MFEMRFDDGLPHESDVLGGNSETTHHAFVFKIGTYSFYFGFTFFGGTQTSRTLVQTFIITLAFLRNDRLVLDVANVSYSFFSWIFPQGKKLLDHICSGCMRNNFCISNNESGLVSVPLVTGRSCLLGDTRL